MEQVMYKIGFVLLSLFFGTCYVLIEQGKPLDSTVGLSILLLLFAFYSLFLLRFKELQKSDRLAVIALGGCALSIGLCLLIR